MKKIIISLFVLALAGGGWFFVAAKNEAVKNQFKFTEVNRGTIETLITSSGTIEAVSTVEVGSQVSGVIDHIYVDFNDNVKRGQLLALLDTTFLAASVRDARAGLTRSEAEYDEALSKFNRTKKLFEKNFVSELDYISAQTTVSTANATLQSSQSALERAITNLKYAIIKSPVSGTVIHRNIERGQTVAASLQAPQLFIIAEDLSNMQILAQVDESDIGQIKEEQEVKFTVQAYPDIDFYGKVKQIRLQPETVSNVVNYTVVIDAANKEQLLLPGMTATVDFYVERKENVLMVSNTALRYKPDDEIMTVFREKMMARMNSRKDSTGFAPPPQGAPFNSKNINPVKNNLKQLWYLDKNNELQATMVSVGVTDGKNTELTGGRMLNEGMKIITGTVTASENKTSNEMGPPPMGGFGPM